MARSMTASGSTESKKATGFGEVKMETPTSASGRAVRRTDMVCMCGATVTDMRVSGEHASVMETARTSSPTVINTSVSTATVILTALVSTNGLMGTHTQENSSTE